MRNLYLSISGLLIGTLFFCTYRETLPSAPESIEVPGMCKIQASGESFLQGSSDLVSSTGEHPTMSVAFTYDYWIDSTEVTQSEFYSICSQKPVPDTSRSGVGAEYPVYNVSWFDAVLFCNEKSKKQHLDTVYAYTDIRRTATGRISDLIGLQIYYKTDGYRLPTESEWEFAARGCSSKSLYTNLSDSSEALANAWYSANSGGKAHPVATKAPNRLGLYDMAGNVFEWTNDWKGPYVTLSVCNSIGSREPNLDYERVIKGGSFAHGINALRPSRRSTTYPTTVTSSAEYAGFRCARGVIPKPIYLSVDSSGALQNPVSLAVTSIKDYLCSSRAKLVFVNVTGSARTLCYINFNEPFVLIHEFTDMKSVYCPTISPDGNYVAFCTRNEGFEGPATTYIRNLNSTQSPLLRLPADTAYVPRWWVDRTSNDTFLVYTNSAIDNRNGEWASTKTYLQKVSAGAFSGSARIFISDGGYHDGISYNGQFIVTGFGQVLMRDLSSNQQKTLFQYPDNGKQPDQSTQVCNVSISPDSLHPDRCMFLDFGSPTPSTLTGESYGAHQYLFVAEFSGKTLSWYKAPASESSWDFPEWSNIPQFAVACGTDAAGSCQSIYLVPLLQQSNCVKLVSGVNLGHSYLWCDPTDYATVYSGDLSLDSLGHYSEPILDERTPKFANRMHGFWRLYPKFRAVFLGSSHTETAIDRRAFTYPGVFNMSITGTGSILVHLEILRNYILNHCDSLRIVGLEVTPGFMTDRNSSAPFLNTLGVQYDRNHDFWTTARIVNIADLIDRAPWTSYYPAVDTLGNALLPCDGWEGENLPISGVQDRDSSSVEFKANCQELYKLSIELDQREIHLVLLIFPESPYYRQTNSYGKYGPNRQGGQAMVSALRALAEALPNCHFFDANNGGDHDYGDDDAWNADHLCEAGAHKFCARLDSLLMTLR
ncbi:MAG: TIGR02171 family protein [Chitinispirillaceae bacterium]|nr:TIGR02171 family protein [Chitinispirillaceae bacterium]